MSPIVVLRLKQYFVFEIAKQYHFAYLTTRTKGVAHRA